MTEDLDPRYQHAAIFDRDTIASVITEQLRVGIDVSGDVCGVPFKFTIKSKNTEQA